MLEQIILLFVVLMGGISAIYLLFWLLFKKDAPTVDDLKKRFEYKL